MSSSVSGMVPICLYVLPQPRHQTRLLVITTLELVRHVESNQKSIIHAQKGPKRGGGGGGSVPDIVWMWLHVWLDLTWMHQA